jgi:2-C-methyl-D-erythritol 4-phosphate cytidylyltransferase/2-C-methyl-D-erythritol 2,4-cyclodiphosphate synthase
MTIAALIVAAGRGLRAGGGLPKQYRQLGSKPVLAHTMELFLCHPSITIVAVVIGAEDARFYEKALGFVGKPLISLATPIFGGTTRQDSVRLGLLALEQHQPRGVLVHDGARPFTSASLIDRAVASLGTASAAIPGVPVTDTIKVVDGEAFVSDTPERQFLRAVQTPQAFAFQPLLEAHRKAERQSLSHFTDDAGLMEWAGYRVEVFEGDSANIKLTHAADFEAAERQLEGSKAVLLTRLGTGFDVHAFTDGDHVWLGGIKVPHDRGVLAHSDGDVILHALTDALLGALADGDIGTHFPPSDPKWRGASSDRFLAHAVSLVRQRGGIVDHLDVTLLCETPRLGPHREAMRRRIAQVAEIAVEKVSLKATTTEKLGFTGRSEGLAAQAAATVRLPETA